jgi:hypothetical protein
MGIVRGVRSMTRAVGMLGSVDEPENGCTRRRHGESNGESEKLRFFWGNSDYTVRLRILGNDCRGLSNANDRGQCRKPREGQLEPPAIESVRLGPGFVPSSPSAPDTPSFPPDAHFFSCSLFFFFWK